MKIYKVIMFFSIIFLIPINLAFSQTNTKDKYASIDDIPVPLRFELAAFGNQSRDQYIERVLKVIKEYGRNQSILDQQTVSALHEKSVLLARQNQVSNIMGYDRNFDGQVTRSEVEASVMDRRGYASDRDLQEIVRRTMMLDTNGDGVITIQEMSTLPPRTEPESLDGPEAFFLLDPNKDGQLTISELQDLAIKAYNTVDSNDDGIISEDERQALFASVRRIK